LSLKLIALPPEKLKGDQSVFPEKLRSVFMIPAHQPEAAVACVALLAPYASQLGESSSYRDRLLPWCIIRHLPNMQRMVVSRHRRRNEAEAHVKILRQLTPNATYVIVFDPPDRA
jgi:hypothetical protein